MSPRARRTTGVGAVVLLLTGFMVYGYFFVWPARRLASVLVDFERAGRAEDVGRLESVVSKDAAFYGRWGELRDELSKFDHGLEVGSARYVSGEPISGPTMIVGNARMRSKIDGNYRLFADITLVRENGSWKLRQFAFPDYVDY